jgi:hypothetical protein
MCLKWISASFFGIGVVLIVGRSAKRSVLPESDSSSPGSAISTKAERLSINLPRPVYRHSIVPGGVATAEEVNTIRGLDPLVAAHYADIDGRITSEAIPRDSYFYVSYRKRDGDGDHVYWTRQRRLLHRGEVVLADGKRHLIRARCGNRLSSTPMKPTESERGASGLDVDELEAPALNTLTPAESDLFFPVPESLADPHLDARPFVEEAPDQIAGTVQPIPGPTGNVRAMPINSSLPPPGLYGLPAPASGVPTRPGAPDSAVPEPGTAVLISLGLLAVLFGYRVRSNAHSY